MMSKRTLLQLVRMWFKSDFDIDFKLSKEGRSLDCTLESDAYYEHINNCPAGQFAETHGTTVRSIRHGGGRRRFIIVSGDDTLFQKLFQQCRSYDFEGTINLIQDLSADGFRIR